MKDIYSILKLFWNTQSFLYEAHPVSGKWVEEHSFNSLVREYISPNTFLLDYGCGYGWASFEINYTVANLNIVGVDTADTAVVTSNQTAKLSELDNIKFYTDDEFEVMEHEEMFDNAIAINLIDVLPDGIIDVVLLKIKESIKEGGNLIISINPDYPLNYLHSMGYIKRANYLYKDDVLRGNIKSKDEWLEIFTKYYKFIEYREYCLNETEHEYPRRAFILRKE